MGNNAAMFRYLYENIVGGGAGGWTKIEDGVDNNSLFSLEVCDTRGFGLEDCLDFGCWGLFAAFAFGLAASTSYGYR